MAPARQYLFVTNRGPFAISPSGSLHEAGGGLAAGLRGLLATGQARSVFAVDDGPEREHWSAVGDDRLIPAAVPEEVHRSAYDTIANELLWYCAHQLFDLAFEPIDDAHSRRAWSHYETFNELMAEAAHAVANVDDVIVVNDYHLYLVPRALRARGWQGTLVFFLHIPVPTEQEYAVLPAVVRRALLDGIAEADLIAVHAPTWAERLRALFDASGLVAPPIVVAPSPSTSLDCSSVPHVPMSPKRASASTQPAAHSPRSRASTASSRRRTCCVASPRSTGCWSSAPTSRAGSEPSTSPTPRAATWTSTIASVRRSST